MHYDPETKTWFRLEKTIGAVRVYVELREDPRQMSRANLEAAERAWASGKGGRS